MTMSAITPTSMKVPSRAFINFMLNAATTTRSTKSRMTATNIFIAADPLIHLNAR